MSGKHGWQPIATAPKDGTTVLVWCPDIYGEIEPIPVAAYWDSMLAWWWPTYYAHGSIDEGLPDEPTHWRPLDPPEAGA